MAKIQLKRSLSEPTPTPQGNSTLRAYNQTGNPVYVERGKYYPGISLTAPSQNINQQTVDNGTLPAGQTPPTTNPQADIFNKMLLDIFKQSQGVSAIDLLKKRRDLEKQQADLVSSEMPSGISPSQQSSIIAGRQALTAADISETDYEIARANKAISNFEDLFYKAYQFGQDFAEKMAIPDGMVQNYKKVIEANPEKFETILSTLNDKSKQAVINSLDYTKMKPKAKTASIAEQLAAEAAGKTISYDTAGNPILSEKKPVTTSDYLTPGVIGGQCGDYTHKIADNIPTMGNTWESKMAIGNMSSMTYKVGDMLIQKTNLPQGHVSIVTSVNGNKATVTESNYGLDEKVGTREITMGDPSVTGIYRGGTLKQDLNGNGDYNQYGLLANTSFNSSDETDKNAANYIDSYLKSKTGALPTATTLFGSVRGNNAAKFVQAQDRAKELFYEATGSSLPDLANISSNKALIAINNKVLNNQAILGETIIRNFDLAIKGEIKNNVNQNATVINRLLNPIYLALGDPAVNQAMVSNGTISQEFANLVSIRNNGGTLAADKEMASELIKFGTSVEAQKAVVERLKAEAANIHGALANQNKELWKLVDPLQQNTQNPNRGGSDEATIKVRLKSTGETGTIPSNEFDSNLYDKL